MGRLLHASYSGYFPSCIGGARTAGVLNGKIADLMYIYWRPKVWEINSIVGQLFVGGGETIWTFNEGKIRLGAVNASTEEELVCGKTFLKRVSVNFESQTPPESPSLASGDFIIFFTPTVSKISDNLYQMTFWVAFEVAGGRQFFTSLPPEFQANQGSQIGTLTIDGTDTTTPIYGSGSITGTMNISIQATEWWPYGGTYNAQTGEPL